MDNFEKSLHAYLNSKHGFAILINGKWGSGKTYYLKNSLFKLTDKSINQIIYTSANGITSFDEIISQILIQKYAILKLGENKIARITYSLLKAASNIGGKFSVAQPVMDFISNIGIKKSEMINLKDNVLIIDDIERINFKELPIEELLGTVNNLFTEHDYIKVILVADESELINALGLADSMKYSRIKEKTIWKTILFQSDTKSILEEIINGMEIESNFKELFKSNLDKFNELFNLTKEKNLRTIKYYFDVLCVICKNISFLKYNKIADEIIQTTFIFVREYKNSKLSSSISPGVMPSYLSDTFGNYFLKIGFDGNQIIDDGKAENNLDEYTEIFQNLGNSYIPLKSIYNIVLFDIVDKEVLNEEIDKVIQSRNIEFEWNIKLKKLINFNILQNEEFIAIYNNVVEYVKAGKYSLSNLIVFTNNSIYLFECGIDIQFESIKEICEFVK